MRTVFGLNTFGNNDNGVVAAAGLDFFKAVDDAVNRIRDFRHQANVGSAGESGVHSQVSGIAAHNFHNQSAVVRAGSPFQTVNRRGALLNSRFKTDGKFGNRSIVVNGFGNAYHRDFQAPVLYFPADGQGGLHGAVAAIGIEDLFSGRALPTLASAELYVPQLGQSFVMTEETALCSLEKALSKEADTVHITPTGADFGEQETLCPLYLRFADGRRALLFTAGDGADGCADGSLLPCAVFGAESVFERFGVPMDAAGYTHNTDGTTTVTNSVGGGASDGMTSTARYDVQGRLVYWERAWTWANRDDTDVHIETVSYREDGKLASTLGRSHFGQSDEYTTLTTYVYNERGDLTRINVEYDPTDIFGPGYYRELRYDEQNRLVAYVFHYADGREGLPSGNTYFWYTEDGQRCYYHVDTNGNLVGGPDGTSGDNPVRR